MKTVMISVALGAATLASPALAQVMTPPEYVMTAGASDLYEISSSRE